MGDDRINWVNGTPREAINAYLRWREAVVAADAGDRSHLVELLRSDHHLGPEARVLVADLIDRHLQRGRGRRPLPAYLISKAEQRIRDAQAHYRYFRKKFSENEAVEATLDELKITKDKARLAMADAIKGRRGSTRRANKRRNVVPTKAGK